MALQESYIGEIEQLKFPLRIKLNPELLREGTIGGRPNPLKIALAWPRISEAAHGEFDTVTEEELQKWVTDGLRNHGYEPIPLKKGQKAGFDPAHAKGLPSPLVHADLLLEISGSWIR